MLGKRSPSPGISVSRHDLIRGLRLIVGRRHVLTDPCLTARYRHGFRWGGGGAIAVVRPKTLLEQWRALAACVAADVSIIFQAANTGLTGGSTPNGDDYPGGVVIISTMRITNLYLLDGGRQAVCLPGTTLHQLERALKPLGREPHSVIGSSCICASVLGGICNNSGGSLIQRGPAYTELALFAQVKEDGTVQLVNHLGIHLGEDPEEILTRLQTGDFAADDILFDPGRKASDHEYVDYVRRIEADTPARFNADPRCLFEASGSAGKLALFAVRLDTFSADPDTATFYIGSNDPAELTALRRHVLAKFSAMPIAAEYIHRAAFDLAARYGKDTFLSIRLLGTDRLPGLLALQARIEGWCARLGLRAGLVERTVYWLTRLLPDYLPRTLRNYRDQYEHHLILKMAGAGIEEARAYLSNCFPSLSGNFFQCTAGEEVSVFLHRFAVAGAAVRYRAVHNVAVGEIVALDIALPRNTLDWVETMREAMKADLIKKLYYGHFFCHVFHQDYVLRSGIDPLAFERRMWELLNRRGAEYPAEHNVGHIYYASPSLREFYRELDPRNQLNPGIGHTARERCWVNNAVRSS
jgi:D-lactate dehydrogenase (quinone)